MATRDTQQAPTTGGIFADLYDIGLGKFKEFVDFEDAESESALARSNFLEGESLEASLSPLTGSALGETFGIDNQTLLIAGVGVVALLILLR